MRITPDVILEDTLPVEERFARTPRHYLIRGLFFEPFVRTLGHDEALALQKDLIAPPEDGEYGTITEYPQVDHARYAVAAARKRWPTVSLREALRRVERSMAAQFAQSSMGKIFNSVLSDPHAVFRALPHIYPLIQTGGRFDCTLRAGTAHIELRDFAPWIDCSTIGALEGLVVLFGKRPSIELAMLTDYHADIEVEWS